MPRVHYVKKAGKDYPQFGIKKGEPHYVWSIRMQRGGRTYRSKTRPRQSQLTHSEYKSQAHAINERVEDLDPADIQDLRDQIAEIVSDSENLRDEQQEKLDNMPEGLQEADTGQLIQSRIEALENFVNELESLDLEDEWDPEDGSSESDWLAEKVTIVQEVEIEIE